MPWAILKVFVYPIPYLWIFLLCTLFSFSFCMGEMQSHIYIHLTWWIFKVLSIVTVSVFVNRKYYQLLGFLGFTHSLLHSVVKVFISTDTIGRSPWAYSGEKTEPVSTMMDLKAQSPPWGVAACRAVPCQATQMSPRDSSWTCSLCNPLKKDFS